MQGQNLSKWRTTLLLLAALVGTLAGVLAFITISQRAEVTTVNDSILFFNLSSNPNQVTNLSTYSGEKLLLNFWAPWCAPCRDEIPLLNSKIGNIEAANVRLIGIAIDSADNVSQFSAQLPLNYININAEHRGMAFAQQLGNDIGALPFSVLINAAGEVEQRHLGELDENILGSWIRP